MTDSIQVFSPGDRIEDANGAAVSGATLEFYDAGTTNAKTVYSDYTLSTSLGSTITCDSGGYPSSGGNKVSVWVGTTAYKVIIKDGSGSVIATHDNQKGALNTSSYLTSAGVINLPITSTSSTTVTLTTGALGTVREYNVTGGSTTVTLPLSATSGNGGTYIIKRKGSSSNLLTIVPTGSDTLESVSSIVMYNDGDVVILTADGAASYKIVSTGNKNQLDQNITLTRLSALLQASVFQIGDIKPVPHGTVPSLWLECDGAAKSRTTFADLYAAIGTTHGSGDGSTTFNLPDYRGRFLRGYDHGAGRDPGAVSVAVTGAANNGSGLIRLTVASTSKWSTGMKLYVFSVGGVTAAQGSWTITVIDSTHIDLQGSTFSGTYTSGGAIWDRYQATTGGAAGDLPGSVEDDAFQTHVHPYTYSGAGGASGTIASVGSGMVTASTSAPSSGLVTTETRPKNAAVMWVIFAGA